MAMGPAQSSWSALGTSPMASCAPHPRVHPILAVLCPRGDAHTPCLHNARIWDAEGRPRDSGNTPWLCLDQAVERAGWSSLTERGDLGTPPGDDRWHQPPCSGFCFPCWKSHHYPCQCHWSGAAGSLRSPRSPPPLTNHLLAKLVINSSSSSLSKLARPAHAAHGSPVPPRPTGTVTRAGTPSKGT